MIPNNRPQSPLVLVGSGALGSLFAAFLEPHAELIMLAHWPEQVQALEAVGLTCVHTHGGQTKHRFAVTTDARRLGQVNLALILVKSYQTARTAAEIAPVLAPDGLAVTFQNGLGNFEILQAALGYGRVAQAVTAQGATLIRPGIVKHAGHGPSFIALIPGKEAPIAGLVELLRKAGFTAAITGDVKSLQWGKLAVNAGINPLTAILRVRNGFLAENELAKLVMCAAAEEAATVAAAVGIELPYSSASQRVTEVAEATADNYSSMLQDILRDSPTEIDAINGAIADYGRRAGIPTPVNDELWRTVRRMTAEANRTGVGNPTDYLHNLLKHVDRDNHDYNNLS